jgi:hypothetical protein
MRRPRSSIIRVRSGTCVPRPTPSDSEPPCGGSSSKSNSWLLMWAICVRRLPRALRRITCAFITPSRIASASTRSCSCDLRAATSARCASTAAPGFSSAMRAVLRSPRCRPSAKTVTSSVRAATEVRVRVRGCDRLTWQALPTRREKKITFMPVAPVCRRALQAQPTAMAQGSCAPSLKGGPRTRNARCTAAKSLVSTRGRSSASRVPPCLKCSSLLPRQPRCPSDFALSDRWLCVPAFPAGLPLIGAKDYAQEVSS